MRLHKLFNQQTLGEALIKIISLIDSDSETMKSFLDEF